MAHTSGISPIDPVQREAAEAQIVEQTKRIEFYITEYTVEILANKMRDEEFVVPAYQREFTWEEERKSRFIESLLMGLPIPFLFFWEMEDGRLEIVDGSQRLRTIKEFLYDNFQLGELDSLPALSHFKFGDLSEARQRKVKNRSIRGIVLNEHADEQARFDMFERINTGSKQANPAEVRRGALAGPFMDLVIELAQNSTFEDIAPLSEKLVMERRREELVLRFFAYSDGLEGYKDRPKEFFFKYAKKMNDQFAGNPGLREHYRTKFQDMVTFVYKTFPNGFRRTPAGNHTTNVRFEALAVGSALALEENPKLADSSPSIEDWIDGEEFKQLTTSGSSNVIKGLKERISFVKDKLTEAVE